MKPVKKGFKLWVLCDSTGFVKKFEVYQGRNEAFDNHLANYTLGEKVVLKLTEQEWGQNKIIYFDNYFTSIRLLEKLKLENTLACGTIRSNRKGLPKNMIPVKKYEEG